MKELCGFSKLSKLEKLNFVVDEYLNASEHVKQDFLSCAYENEKFQRIHEQFSENTISNFHLPYGVVPHLLMNGVDYCVPMVIEESSVVAACSRSAKFWKRRGGFHAEVISKIKTGQVHFYYSGPVKKLKKIFNENKAILLTHVREINCNMSKRGGGILDIALIDKTQDEPNYYQLSLNFNTCDAQGANYINTNLETLAFEFKKLFSDNELEIIFSIVSNYTPDSLVRCYVTCSLSELHDDQIEMPPELFATRFKKAVRISQVDITRAVTHNKGIMNGVDAVAIATGNDFRSIEACVHAFASKEGTYRGLTNISLENNKFYYELIIPLSVGTVGGLTNLHPLASNSLNMLKKPHAEDLMKIMACVGLAQNFAAIRSLVTSGIQKGHMKMHLINILNYFEASEKEKEQTFLFFKDKRVSFNEVRSFLGRDKQLQ